MAEELELVDVVDTIGATLLVVVIAAEELVDVVDAIGATLLEVVNTSALETVCPLLAIASSNSSPHKKPSAITPDQSHRPSLYRTNRREHNFDSPRKRPPL